VLAGTGVIDPAGQRPDASLVGTDRTERRNVVLVFLESTRGISTTLADPDLATTPFLEELARTSLVAENAYTVVPHTSKALASGHCGVAPPLDMLVTESRLNGINAPCLPALLGQQGYRSAFFQSATEHYDDRRGLVEQLGYDDFVPVDEMPTDDHERANYFGYEDDIMLGPSREWLEDHGDQPFLTGYLTVTAHHDYRVPSTLEREDLAADPELDDYLNTLRYQDRFVERLFDQYRELGLYDDTVFVVMADHGEGFGEHGLRQHDNTVYEEGVKIPLLVHDPSDLRPRTVGRPVSNTAVLPTVLDRLGYAVQGRPYPSPSLDAVGDVGQPVRIACYVADHCLASVRGTQKYVFHFGRRPDELFDLTTDPGERHNLLSVADRAEATELRDDLLRWRAEVRELTASRS
jgi:lipoteichoic acid synthase